MWANFRLQSSFLFLLCFHPLKWTISTYRAHGIMKEALQSFGEQLTNALITAETDVSFIDCIKLCQRRRRCLSVNYMQTFLVCQLNYRDKSQSDSTFVMNSVVLYSEKKSWIMMFRDPCSKRQCGENEKCVEREDGLTDCVKSDCGKGLPDVTEAERNKDNGIGIYSKVSYHCEGRYLPEGKPYIGCKANGDWSSISFRCFKGCNDSWEMFGTSCYRIVPHHGDWTTQKSYCISVGAVLAEITSYDEEMFIEDLLQNNGVSEAWIGGNDIDNEGTWKWAYSNTTFWYTQSTQLHVHVGAYHTWGPFQPDDANNNEDCLEILKRGWNDRQCVKEQKGICEEHL